MFTRFSIVLLLVIFSTSNALSCTRIFRVDKQNTVMAARSMDWLQEMDTDLVIYPRGIERDGKASIHSLSWISRYGSVVAVSRGVTTDGINEKGLAAHLLVLPESNYGVRDAHLPALSVLLWAQYYLDNFQTVEEALQAMDSNLVQLEPFFEPQIKKWLNMHLALEDASGDSAVIEYMNGKAVIYHAREDSVLTNGPTYDKQLTNLKEYQDWGGDQPLPGTSDSRDRFVRASYYLSHLSEPSSTFDAMIQLIGIIQNTSTPYGVVSTINARMMPYTVWYAIADLTHRIYYFKSVMQPNMIWVSLNNLDFSAQSPVMKLNLGHHEALTGEVSGRFESIS